jgi:hypothetical protein
VWGPEQSELEGRLFVVLFYLLLVFCVVVITHFSKQEPIGELDGVLLLG